MTKITKSILIVMIIAVSVMALIGCQNFSWGPVGPITTGEVENNGSLVVKQGDYLYYVNGMDETSNITKPEDNHFGKASVKGSIMKSKINADGTLSDTAVVVPKTFYTANTSAGIYIFGQWIYYCSPSTQTDKYGNVLTSNLEYMRTKLDGSKTQSIAIVEGTSVNFIFTETALIYVEGSELKKVEYTEKKIGKESVIASDITGSLFTAQSDVVFYTTASEDKTLNNNLVWAIKGNTAPIAIVSDGTYASGETPTLKEQKTISLVKYDKNENVLYYTRTDNDTAAVVGTYGYKFDQLSAIDKTKEKKYSVSSLTTFTPLGFDNGLLVTSSSTVKVYNPISEQVYVDDIGKEIELSSTPTVLFFENDYVYYVISNSLMRMDYNAAVPTEEKISDQSISTSWLAPVKLGNYIYYIDGNNYNYLYRLDYTTYAIEEGVVTKAEGKIVSGYVSSDETSDGLVPQFMSDADKESYIKANPAE
ncbi:MAG: hypothetical protein ACI4MI_03105 [Christensenellales bacterium]